jgi:hypothetical protein
MTVPITAEANLTRGEINLLATHSLLLKKTKIAVVRTEPAMQIIRSITDRGIAE